jgi:maleylpyruvate isomerase
VVLDGLMESRRTTESEIATGLLGDSSVRLLRTVDGFHGDDWSAPSALPGWARADVVAHLALNAEGLTRVLQGLVADDDEPATMYASDEARDSDIRALAGADPSEIRSRLMAATTILDDAIGAVPADQWPTIVERTPGGRSMRADSLPGMRLRELEIHHVDLDSGYSRTAWPETFTVLLLHAMTKRLHPPEPFEVRPLDLDRTWVLGTHDHDDVPDAALVTGPAADLGWWLTGRPAPDTLSCSRGELPSIESW